MNKRADGKGADVDTHECLSPDPIELRQTLWLTSEMGKRRDVRRDVRIAGNTQSGNQAGNWIVPSP